MWALELRLSEKQGAEARILAPDEPGARAAFEAAHPDRARARECLIAALVRSGVKTPPVGGAEGPVARQTGLRRVGSRWGRRVHLSYPPRVVDIARREGITRARVTQIMSLLKLSEDVKATVLAGGVPRTIRGALVIAIA